MFQLITICSSIIILIMLIGNHLDYRLDPVGARQELSQLGTKIFTWVVFMILLFVLIKVPDGLRLWKDDMGMAFNGERLKLDLPLLDKKWRKIESTSFPFFTTYTNTNPGELHYQKLIEFDILGPKTETDVYLSPLDPYLKGLRVYNYETESFNFLILKTDPEAERFDEPESKVVDQNTFELYFRP